MIENLGNVRIGPSDYKVILQWGLRDDENGQPLDGHIRYRECLILIEENMEHQRQALILMHEIIHGIMTHLGIDDHDEKLVETLGVWLTMVFRDNPMLADIFRNLGNPKPEGNNETERN